MGVKFCAVAIAPDEQYRYDGTCISLGFTYEDSFFKGYECFTYFDQFYFDLLDKIKLLIWTQEGEFRLFDVGGDTDGFIDFYYSQRVLNIEGCLGSSTSDFSLRFRFRADQTLLSLLLSCIGLT